MSTTTIEQVIDYWKTLATITEAELENAQRDNATIRVEKFGLEVEVVNLRAERDAARALLREMDVADQDLRDRIDAVLAGEGKP